MRETTEASATEVSAIREKAAKQPRSGFFELKILCVCFSKYFFLFSGHNGLRANNRADKKKKVPASHRVLLQQKGVRVLRQIRR